MASNAENVNLKGGCHCGFIKYTCTIKTEALQKAIRCNCTFCTKLSAANVNLTGPEDFHLLSPASESECGTYAVHDNGKRYFCSRCGTQVWMQAQYEMFGKQINQFAINLHSVDQPQDSGFDLSQVKFSYYDGLNNNFAAGLSDKPWKGGLV